jgi:hypothetical protein
MMRKFILIFIVVMGSGSAAQAMEFMKCNSMDGKTLWASFGKRANSDGVKYFAIEVTLFRSATELQQRILFRNSKEAMAAMPIAFSPTKINFALTSVGVDGAPSVEIFELHLYSPRSATAFSGTWVTQNSSGSVTVPLACSVY